MWKVLVTGASTGIGFETSRYLVERGCVVMGGCRNQEAADRLRSIGVGPLILDVTKEADIQQAYEQVSAWLKGGDRFCLVNNAGLVVAGPVELLPMEEVRYEFEVNVFSVVRLCQVFLPLLRKCSGRIVNMSSVSGRMSLPGLGAYSGSKFALEAFSDSLRRELRPQKIEVVLIEPGPIKTPIWEKSALKSRAYMEKQESHEAYPLYKVFIDKLNEISSRSAENAPEPIEVAKLVHQSIESSSPKARYVVGISNWLRAQSASFVPAKTVDYLISKAFR